MRPMQTFAALAAVIATAAPLTTPARADSDFPPAISVTGQADISVAPDLARIDAGVATDGKTAREASDANNTAMGKVLLALKTLGLDQKDYQTSQLSLQPQYAPNRNASGPSPIVGYRASNRVTIKIRDITRVASVIDAVVAAGANDVGNIYFSVSQASKLLDDARTKALADARRKADIYAKAAGVTLGAPLSISEGGIPMPLFHAKVAAPFAAAAPVPVAPGEETLSVNVSASWAIKPGP